MRILVFGDSITQGFYDTQGGWVNRLFSDYIKQYYKGDKDPPTIFNLGISGDKSDKVLARLDHEVKSRIWPGEKFVIVFAVGLNNTYKKHGKFYGSVENFASDITKLYKLAKEHSQRIMFVGLSAVNESLTSPVGWDDIYWSNDRIWKFEQALRTFCEDNNLPSVKTFELFRDGNTFLADGIHPNDAGHELIASLVKPELDKLINS